MAIAGGRHDALLADARDGAGYDTLASRYVLSRGYVKNLVCWAGIRKRGEKTSLPSLGLTWRAIPCAPDYEISELGHVRRLVARHRSNAGYVLKGRIDRDGYYKVTLVVDGKKKYFGINRLVAQSFHGEPSSPGLLAAHWDGNRKNNHFTNIYWATPAQNVADTERHGRTAIGIRQPHAKLTDERSARLRERRAQGATYRQLGAEFGISAGAVAYVISGRRWIEKSASGAA